MKSIRLTLLLFLTGLCALTSAEAQQKEYDVELIVFSNTEPGMTDETPAGLVFEDAQIVTPPGRFTRLGVESYQLQTEARRLNNSRLYEPLLHVAWRQPGLDRNAALPFAISGGEGQDRVTGTVTVALERYLHVDLDLKMSSGEASWAMRERRRMRSRETHYIDHPRFGVLLRITPVD